MGRPKHDRPDLKRFDIVRYPLSRRELLVSVLSTATLAAPGSGLVLAAESPIDLKWSDLVPDAAGTAPQIPTGVIQHGEMSTPAPQQSDAPVTFDYNGKTVRIPGYIVPLDYDGTGTKEFLLVPYVGACIHVPPPPANQLVFVSAEKPYEFKFMFEPVYVTGEFNTAAMSTDLAEVGYSLAANKIEPYE